MRRSTFVLAAAAVAAFPMRAGAQTLTPIRIAVFPGDTSAQAYFAQEQGFFTKNGLEATITELRNGAAGAAAVVGGSIDIANSSPLSIYQGFERGVPFVILAGAAESHIGKSTSSVLVAGKTSSIRTGKDLNGKTVAVGVLGGLPGIAVRAWIDKGGGDSSTVKFLELPYGDMIAAVNTDRVSAAALNYSFDPLLGKPNDPVQMIGAAYDAVGPIFSSSDWFAMSDWSKKNPDTVRKFIQSMKQAAQWGNTHPRETAVIISKHTKQPVAEIEAGGRAIYTTDLTPDLLQPTIDLSAKYGALKKPFPASELIYTPGK